MPKSPPEPAEPQASNVPVPSAPAPETVIDQLRADLSAIEKMAAEDAQRAATETGQLRDELSSVKEQLSKEAAQRQDAERARDELAKKLADAREELARTQAEQERAEQRGVPAQQAPLPSTRVVRACSSLVTVIDGMRREFAPGSEFAISAEELSQLPAESWEEI